MFDQYQSNTLDAWKLEFIGLICQQEYFVQLNLPILIDKNNKVFYSLESVLALEVAHEFRLSEEFRTKHYLIGLVLHILKENFYASKKIRKCTVQILRNILAKHSFDDRLDGIVRCLKFFRQCYSK
uniref:Uncharacterized protein n=1 Tax=Romanomermis culicivorax TaxID=13658 RepID=A0A915HKI5_ROMCU